MNLQASIEQVAGILVREGLAFQTLPGGDSYRVELGEDAVFINFHPWQGDVCISLLSFALQDIDADEAPGAITHAELGDLNDRHHFVKWTFLDGALMAEHDLLGTDLQACELLNAIYALAGATAETVHDLGEQTGGLRWAAACEIAEDEIEVEDE